MINHLIPILTIIVALVGLFFLIFLWSNAELKSTFDKFSALRVETRIQVAKRQELSMYYHISKRLFDFTFTLFAIVIFLPVLVPICILIKLDSKGPILYKQKRFGINGKHYWGYKFRTMYVPEEEENSDFPKRSDPRITKIGKFLRLTALDELPAFINVLEGDMSLVGRSRILDYDTSAKNLSLEEKDALLSVKPGVISLWAISRNRVEFNFDNIYDYDMYYLTRMSFRFDLKILLGSIIVVLGSTSQH